MVENLKGLKALSPLIIFIILYLVTSLIAQDFYKIPIIIAFLISSIYALIFMPKVLKTNKRVEIFCNGAGKNNIMFMLLIFILAGAFANSAKDMGCIDATVNLALIVLPPNMLLAGIFLASCFVSMAIGTSVGSIVALIPIAGGIAETTGISLNLVSAIVVGGSFFGDNLSFISDTTVVSTNMLGCKMNDKFKVNSFIVMPAAIIALIIYFFIGIQAHYQTQVGEIEYIKVIPYITVLIAAVCGINVLLVLIIGIILTGTIGIWFNCYDIYGCLKSMNDGIIGMSELIIVTMLAGGLLEIVKYNGGIDFIIQKLTNRIHSKKGAELSIGVLVSLVNICTANNTVAILTVGGVAKNICNKYNIDNRKAASILDTFSCCIQGIIPYGAQILIAASLTKLNPINIVPYLYYPMLIGLSTFIAIILRYPKRYS